MPHNRGTYGRESCKGRRAGISIMTNSALVTGGAGFIGSHLVRALLHDGCHVRVLDNFSTGNRTNLAEVESSIELIEGDIRHADTCSTACDDIDTIYHLAALGSVPRSIDDPLTTNAVNVVGTLNMLGAARDTGVTSFVFASSSSVYGDTPTLPKHESMRPLPRSPYAVSKLACEEYCRAFASVYTMNTVILRYFNVFGPRQNPNSQYSAVIPRLLLAITEGQQPILYGDGLQSRDFTYVDNVVNANRLAARAPDVSGQIFNIACGEQITLKQVLSDIAVDMKCEVSPCYQPARPGDVKHSRADIEAAQKWLGYTPKVLYAEGIKQTVHFYMTHSVCSK